MADSLPTLEDLVARLERATEGSDALDRAVIAALGIDWSPDEDGNFGGYNILPARCRVTRSIDAALSLMNDTDWGVAWDVESVARGCCVYVWTDHPTRMDTFVRSPLCGSRAAAMSHLPRLIVIAALKARAS